MMPATTEIQPKQIQGTKTVQKRTRKLTFDMWCQYEPGRPL